MRLKNSCRAQLPAELDAYYARQIGDFEEATRFFNEPLVLNT